MVSSIKQITSPPIVSIITATFNAEKQIKDTYLSILEQSLDNWEWIITDDSSTDKTYEILRNIASKDSRIKIIKNSSNVGAGASRNKSLSLVKGEFVAFIDSDDLWHSNKLTSQVEFMKSSFNFSFTAYELIDIKGNSLNKRVDADHNFSSVNYEDMLKKKATIGCSTVMLRKNFIKGSTMPLIRTGQDYAFWLLLLKKNQSAYLLPQVLTQYRIRPNSISRNKIKKALRQWQIYRKLEKLSFFKSVINFYFYAYRAVYKK